MSGCESDPDTSFDSNELFMKPKLLKNQNFYNNCITIVLTSLFFITFIVLFIKLRVVVRTKNGEDDSYILLLLLSLSFLISESLDALVILFDKFALKPYYNIQAYYIRFQVVTRTIITINTVTHCFICLLTSSEYFNAAKKLLKWNKKPKIQPPDVPSISTIRNVDGSNTEY
ncbi:hypothetical protein L3Y34_006950 [Caenorhabditis briggsae]|uniref:Uncharacterized protein n=1 Tax=Caenorhabditis briggsae TaxID=6238 RepID=A0AAE9A2Q5_CAEBR|nr:hypothetical protein L3Y34_006950 [Caenorhabditis briggsae]